MSDESVSALLARCAGTVVELDLTGCPLVSDATLRFCAKGARRVVYSYVTCDTACRELEELRVRSCHLVSDQGLIALGGDKAAGTIISFL